MAYDLSNYLVVGVSSRTLFDLEMENEIFYSKGYAAYRHFQIEHERDILKPGPGFALIKALLSLNGPDPDKRKTEIIIMSRNMADTSLRMFNSLEYYELDITRAVLTGGGRIAPYLNAFKVDLYLSKNSEDVQSGINAGVASAILYDKPDNPTEHLNEIRIAFDGDAVLFSDESERIYQEQGLEAFVRHEKANGMKPLPDGPFAKLLRSLSNIQSEYDDLSCPIRTALVTARNTPSHERVIRTLREWNVTINEAFFLGGISKSDILAAFRPHIFFDDQISHCERAAHLVPTARVPWKACETE